MVACVCVCVSARDVWGIQIQPDSENDVHYFMRQGKEEALVTTDLHKDLEELVVSVQLDHFDIYRRW